MLIAMMLISTIACWMGRKLLRRPFKFVSNIFVFLDTWLSFVPWVIINYSLSLVAKTKCDIDFIKRTYTLLAISSALVMATILSILGRVFNVHSLILYASMVLYSVFVLNVSWVAYRVDPTIEISCLGNDNVIEKFTDRLVRIKLWSFYIFLFILAIIFPRK